MQGRETWRNCYLQLLVDVLDRRRRVRNVSGEDAELGQEFEDLGLGVVAVDQVEDRKHIAAEVVDEGGAFHLGLEKKRPVILGKDAMETLAPIVIQFWTPTNTTMLNFVPQ